MKLQWNPERLRKLRDAYGASQSEFAQLLRVPIDTLQNWEIGRSVWKPIAEFRFDQLAAELAEQPSAVAV